MSVAASRVIGREIALGVAGAGCILAGLWMAILPARLVTSGLKTNGIVLALPRGPRHPMVSLRVDNALIIRELGGFSRHELGSRVVIVHAVRDVNAMQIDTIPDMWGRCVGTLAVGFALVGAAFVSARMRAGGRNGG